MRCSLGRFLCLVPVVALAVVAPSPAAEPIKALLVTGGCCHDYDFQKRIIADGIEARANVKFTVVHDGGDAQDAKIPLYNDPAWADKFDVVVHDECFARIPEQEWMDKVLAPHRKGKPAVLLHCAMHCYRSGTDEWFKFCGIQSAAHGPQVPIAITLVDREHPITKTGGDWTTIQEELYNNLKLFDTIHPLQKGKQHITNKDGKEEDVEYVVTWTNEYEGKTKVFATTIGHNNMTCADPRYLDTVTRGLLWTVDKLNDDYLKPFDAAEHKFAWTDDLKLPEPKGKKPGPQPKAAPEKK